MWVARHRARLHERLVWVAVGVEKAYAQAIAPTGLPAAVAARPAAMHDSLVSLSIDVRSETMAYMARFRPIAADLRFATTVLGCAFDLQEAAAAVDGIRVTLGGLERPGGLPHVEWLMSRVHGVVCLMSDAVVAWDARGYEAARALQQAVALSRERMHGEIARALVQPDADVSTLIEIDGIGCLLQRVSAASGSCIRRLSMHAAFPSTARASQPRPRPRSTRHSATAEA